MSMTYNVSEFARYPIDIYHPAIRFVMKYILPFGLVITMPVTILLKENIIHGPLAPLLLSVRRC